MSFLGKYLYYYILLRMMQRKIQFLILAMSGFIVFWRDCATEKIIHERTDKNISDLCIEVIPNIANMVIFKKNPITAIPAVCNLNNLPNLTELDLSKYRLSIYAQLKLAMKVHGYTCH